MVVTKRYTLTPLPQLLRVCSRVARFIYWRWLNHFFLPVHAGVSLLHTIKSVVFLLDLYTGVCGKRYIKSASCSNIVVYYLIITSPLRLWVFTLQCYSAYFTPLFLFHAVARKDTTAGDWVIDSPTTYLPQSLLASC